MDAIEKQQKNQLEVIKKDDKTKNIAFLKWRIYKLFKIYPRSFNKRSKKLSKDFANKENNISYKHLSYKAFLMKKIKLYLMKLNFEKIMVCFMAC